jgi:hypothetical protein
MLLVMQKAQQELTTLIWEEMRNIFQAFWLINEVICKRLVYEYFDIMTYSVCYHASANFYEQISPSVKFYCKCRKFELWNVYLGLN